MYVPDHFRPTEEDVAALLDGMGAGELITATAEGLLATLLPLIWEPAPERAPGEGVLGRLMGHVARNNRQWKTAATGDAMVIVRGPDAYISPSWYATKREHGRVVPTWNYLTAHLHGPLVVHDDADWCERNVRALVARHEGRRPHPWSVDEARGEDEAQPEPIERGRRGGDRRARGGGRRIVAGDRGRDALGRGPAPPMTTTRPG